MRGGREGDGREEWKGSVISRSQFLTFCVFVLYIIADETSLENIRSVCVKVTKSRTRL